MGMNIRPWNQAFLQNFQQAMLTPEQVQALIAQQQMQNINPRLTYVGNNVIFEPQGGVMRPRFVGDPIDQPGTAKNVEDMNKRLDELNESINAGKGIPKVDVKNFPHDWD